MLAWIFNTINRRSRARFAGIPGPSPRFPLGTAGAFIGRKPWELCADYGRQFGGVTLIWLLNKPALVLNDPALIGRVLDTQDGDFYKDEPVGALKPVITPMSLFITNFGRGWEQARRANPFSTVPFDDWLARQVRPLLAVLAETMKSWIARSAFGPIDLYWATQRLMFDVFAKAFWGRTFPSDRFEWFQKLARTGHRRMNPPKPFLPSLDPFFYVARHKWYGSFEQIVADTRRNPNRDSPDMLNVALASGTPLSDVALAEALATNFFGGVFSCSSTVNTTLHLLAQYPEESAKVARAVRDDLPADVDRTALDGCRPLEFAIREAMRYYPAVPLYFRKSAPDREVRLGRHTLPPNTQVFISNWFLHKFSPHWREPDRFDPSRWDDGTAEATPYGSGFFFPFGRGPRSCIGAGFGQFIHRLVLAGIYRATEPVVDTTRPYEQSFFFGTMMPKAMFARFNPRS